MRQRQSSVTTETQYPVRSMGAPGLPDWAGACAAQDFGGEKIDDAFTPACSLHQKQAFPLVGHRIDRFPLAFPELGVRPEHVRTKPVAIRR